MSDVVASARTARERLAQGLGALQGPGVPEHLLTVAEPIARAMSHLHRIETSGGGAVREAAPQALEAVRAALGMLQSQPVNHPSVDLALQSVAESLGAVHQLVKVTSAPPQAPVQPYPAQMPFAATALAAAPNDIRATQRTPPTNAQAPAPMATAPVPLATAAATHISVGAPPPSSATPDSAFAPNSTLQSQGAERAFNAPGAERAPNPSARAPVVATQPQQQRTTQPEPVAPAGVAPGQLRVEAALGAHSPTNFYKGLSGNDVVDAGGIFVATYQIPRIGTPLLLKVSLPGGYEFEAQAIVRWTREPASDTASPGFGAQFTVISPEGRQLVYRYVRNREPLFHDDL